MLLESNYDEAMLVANPNYPGYLKARIAGRRGHLSNAEAAECVAFLAGRGVKNIILGHLSEQNNTPETALRAAGDALCAHGLYGAAKLTAALQNEITEVTEV